MKKIKYIFLVFFAFCFWKCSFSVYENIPNEKEKAARIVRSKVAKRLQQEMNLIPFGSGGQMMYQIQKLCLDFEYRKPIDIEEARRMLVRATNIFLEEVNANERVRPYLHRYPFLPRNVEIVIVIQNPNGSNVDGSKLSIIANENDFLEYRLTDKKTFEYITEYTESYQEALDILKQQEEQHMASLGEAAGV